jgi:hypothetical protein
MKVRQHLRLWAVLSLVAQSAWLFALVPADCCAAHTPAAEERSCHETVQVTHCPMKDSTGAACPMHQPGHAHPAADDCRLTGTCSGPMSAFISLLSAHAVLSEPIGVLSPLSTVQLALDTTEQLVSRLVPPDAPPPRSAFTVQESGFRFLDSRAQLAVHAG